MAPVKNGMPSQWDRVVAMIDDAISKGFVPWALEKDE
jgi:hypothetical protein